MSPGCDSPGRSLTCQLFDRKADLTAAFIYSCRSLCCDSHRKQAFHGSFTEFPTSQRTVVCQQWHKGAAEAYIKFPLFKFTLEQWEYGCRSWWRWILKQKTERQIQTARLDPTKTSHVTDSEPGSKQIFVSRWLQFSAVKELTASLSFSCIQHQAALSVFLWPEQIAPQRQTGRAPRRPE